MAALTQADLTTFRDALIRARAGGVREVRDSNGETLTYKSDAEMAAALRDVESRIAQFNQTRPTSIRWAVSKGL
jgi:hypothetical protein